MTGLLLAAAALVLVLVGGGFPRRVPGVDVLGHVGGASVAGLVVLHLGWTLAGYGLAWSRGLALAVAAAGALIWRRVAAPSPPVPLRRPGWGLVVGALPIGIYAALAAVRLAHSPDFVFHWGTKARRWLLAGGVDFDFLTRPSGWRLNPGYPQLLPETMALPGLLGGEWNDRAALLVAPAAAAAIVLLLRHAARAAGASGFVLEAATAAAGLTIGGFGFIHGGAGGADELIALALLAGTAALLRREAPGAATAAGLAAALAAAAKTEGLVLAGLLIVADLAAAGAREGWLAVRRRLPSLALPAAAVIGLWRLREGALYLPTRADLPDAGRIGELLAAAGRVALRPDGGVQIAVLLLLPWCWRQRRLRLATSVVLAQLGAYVVVYLLEPIDPAFLVASSLARLASHLLPATILLLAVGAVRLHPDDGLAPARIRE